MQAKNGNLVQSTILKISTIRIYYDNFFDETTIKKIIYSRLIEEYNIVSFSHDYRHNYNLYKNPGFLLVNSRCIFRLFSYLGLISFIFIAAGLFA